LPEGGCADSGPYELRPVGRVVSPLTDVTRSPRQGDEGAPPARIAIDALGRPALRGLEPGDEVLVLTWLHLADRDVLQVHPRGDTARPVTGVFATRSPDRPNPIGLHSARVVSVEEDGFTIDGIEAVDGTPVLDVKPALRPVGER
jgi:tRNA-Thr(GGU) m(6)t(6)A37 methyltransferase TsaA